MDSNITFQWMAVLSFFLCSVIFIIRWTTPSSTIPRQRKQTRTDPVIRSNSPANDDENPRPISLPAAQAPCKRPASSNSRAAKQPSSVSTSELFLAFRSRDDKLREPMHPRYTMGGKLTGPLAQAHKRVNLRKLCQAEEAISLRAAVNKIVDSASAAAPKACDEHIAGKQAGLVNNPAIAQLKQGNEILCKTCHDVGVDAQQKEAEVRRLEAELEAYRAECVELAKRAEEAEKQHEATRVENKGLTEHNKALYKEGNDLWATAAGHSSRQDQALHAAKVENRNLSMKVGTLGRRLKGGQRRTRKLVARAKATMANEFEMVEQAKQSSDPMDLDAPDQQAPNQQHEHDAKLALETTMQILGAHRSKLAINLLELINQNDNELLQQSLAKVQGSSALQIEGLRKAVSDITEQAAKESNDLNKQIEDLKSQVEGWRETQMKQSRKKPMHLRASAWQFAT